VESKEHRKSNTRTQTTPFHT